MVDFEILDLSDQTKWKQYLIELPTSQQDIYYTPEYYQLYEGLGDGKARCFVFKKGYNIALYPFLINSVNALGYENLDKEYYDIQGAYGYNGVVSSSYDQEFIDSFYQSFNVYCTDNNVIAEFTRFHPLIKNSRFSSNKRNVLFDRNTIYVDLRKDYEKIFQGFQNTTKKQIKRGLNKYSFTLRIFRNEPHIANDFYNIYKESMDRVKSIKYLYFNKKYFEEILKINDTFLFVVYNSNHKPISSIITLNNGKYIHGHLGGTVTDYLNLSPSSYLYSEIIKFGKKLGCHYFHIGGGATPKKDDPVFTYKKHFSQSIADFYIGKKVHNPIVYENIVNQWQKLYPKKIETYKNQLLKYRN